MERPGTEEIATALREVNSLRTEAMYFIAFISVAVMVYFFVSKRLQLRREEANETRKEERSNRYAAALEKMSATMGGVGNALHRVDGTMSSVNDCIHKMDSAVNVLIAKHDGKINLEDSTRMVHDKFFVGVVKEFSAIVERSLSENDYARRSDHITRKVKTDLGEVLYDAREFLSSFNLSVDPKQFFPVVPNSPVERFLLCDIVWNRIEPLFRQEIALKLRIEEARLLICNDVTDHMTLCERGTRLTRRAADVSSAEMSKIRHGEGEVLRR